MPKQATWAALGRSNSFCFSLFRNRQLSTKLCETASNLGIDLELLESIEYESPTSEVESETKLETDSMPKQATWAALRRTNSFCFSLFRNRQLSTKLCETADVTSNLGSDLEILESIECESPTSEVESETKLEIEKEAIQNQKFLT